MYSRDEVYQAFEIVPELKPTPGVLSQELSDGEASATAARIAAEAAARSHRDPTKSRHGQACWVGYECRRSGVPQVQAIQAAKLFHQLTRVTNPTGKVEPFTEAEAISAVMNAYRADAEVRVFPANGTGAPAGMEPLGVPNDEVEPFPIEVLPDSLARLVRTAARALPCPPEYIAVPMFAVLGAAIGTSRVIEVKPGWREGARLYTAVVSPPGSKKSPALDIAMGPLRGHQILKKAEYEREKQEYHKKRTQHEMDLAMWREAVKQKARGKGPDPGDPPIEPEPPTLSQVFTTDATMEALGLLLLQNPRGLLFARDELAGWARSMDQYRGGKGDDRQKWLSFWGGSPVIINRKSRGEAVVLPNPFVCVTGCLPPDVLRELSDERGSDDGFVHRILFSYPDPVPAEWTEECVESDLLTGYQEVWDRLRQLSPTLDEARQEQPKVVTFTRDGKLAYVEWAESHYAEMANDELPYRLRGPWSKLEGTCARLALILQASRYVSGEADVEQVDAVSVAGAAALIDYFKSHNRRVYARLHATKEDKQILQVVDWLRKRGGKTTLRDVMRHNVAGVKKHSEASVLLNELAERGYGTIQQGERSDSIVFELVAAPKH